MFERFRNGQSWGRFTAYFRDLLSFPLLSFVITQTSIWIDFDLLFLDWDNHANETWQFVGDYLLPCQPSWDHANRFCSKRESRFLAFWQVGVFDELPSPEKESRHFVEPKDGDL
jgi:hypothetical protein